MPFLKIIPLSFVVVSVFYLNGVSSRRSPCARSRPHARPALVRTAVLSWLQDHVDPMTLADYWEQTLRS